MKRRAILIIAGAQVAVLALWFSAAAVVPAITAEFALSPGWAGLLTSAVQAGFVAGTLVSAVLLLADRIEPRRLFAVSALIGAGANLALLWTPMDSPGPLVLRFVTGMAMAGVYPVGMKMIGTWAERDLGLLIGILVGALCLGSGAPHLFNVFGGFEWRWTIAIASATAAGGAALIGLAALGPRARAAARFDPGAAMRALAAPGLGLTLLGYLGHMWELYAMWAWIGVFLDASFRLSGTAYPGASGLVAFASIGLGGLVGSIAGGALADRIGRTALTAWSMALSGSCAIAAGLLFGADGWIVAAVVIVWGVFICADSAQFSAAITELSEPAYVGTMLTLQTCCGFLLTLATIQLMPVAVGLWGWTAAFALLAIGPACGVAAMLRLRGRPEAVKLAGGRR